ncbi:MAG: SUMF1/EgtB/PvdO family nonheme iron enzyme [Candidatus Sericytochromatia bacterium]
MMKKHLVIFFSTLLSLQLLNTNVIAAPSKQKATIKKIKNKVEYKYEETSWESAKINQEIIPVTSIRTGTLSNAEIMFPDGTITRIGSKTSFTFLDKNNRAVKVQFGKVWFNVKKKSNGLKIYSSRAVAAITGTEGFVEFEGNVEDEVYIVKKDDNLSLLAEKFLGKTAKSEDKNNFIKKILELNPKVIKDKNLIYENEKLVINKNSVIKTANKNGKESSFALGLIEGTTDVFKAGNNGEPVGDVQKVKEGQLLKLQGDNFSIAKLDSAFPKNMVPIKGGTFKMGGEGEIDEKPIHSVNINTFLISKYEVTQSEYQDLMDKNPSNFKGNDLPVEKVSWWDAIKYCNAKSKKENFPIAYDEKTGNLLDSNGKFTKDITEVVGYRLPTEAEWEYAAKGGYKSNNYNYSGSNNIEEVSWFGYDLAEKTTHPVGNKKANELGLFDMSGNVSEWVYDAYIPDAYKKGKNNNPYFEPTKLENYRTYRGGSWDAVEKHQTVFGRTGYLPDHKSNNIGFRIAKNLSF